MPSTHASLPARLARKLTLYGGEVAYAVRAPATLDQSIRLLASTAAFHYRNWLKRPLDPVPRLELDLDVGGARAPVTLRPRDGDLAILYEVFAGRAYDIPDALLNPEHVHTIVDAGANIGFASLFLAARYPNAQIFAVEPNPDNFALLKSNTAHEPRITPVEACITAAPAQQVYIETAGRASHFRMSRNVSGVSVRGMSLDELADLHGLTRIDLLKMDVEGAEREIFAHASFLKRVGMIAAELHGAYDLARFNTDLAPWGFNAWHPNRAADPALVFAGHKDATAK